LAPKLKLELYQAGLDSSRMDYFHEYSKDVVYQRDTLSLQTTRSYKVYFYGGFESKYCKGYVE